MPVYKISYYKRCTKQEITEEELVLWLLCPEEKTYIEYKNDNNDLHRLDGPALIDANGYQAWYKHGFWHREDGPAIIYHDGRQAWYRNGERIK